MKPTKIFIVRHGESEGNIDKTLYATRPDYAMKLTMKGHEQANAVGKEIAQKVGSELAQFYVSPYWRTRQTYQEIAKSFPEHRYYEDPRLREQEWGNYRDASTLAEMEEARDTFGHFYYRIGGGESCADVFDRVTSFMNTAHRDFRKLDFPKVCFFITHGKTMRLILMRWFHWSVEEFEMLKNPRNCEYFLLELNPYNGKYDLITTPEKYDSPSHPYQFPWK